jgi:hypothetical protein
MPLCPECGNENSADAQFCVDCHHTMYYRCPNCWHHQQTPGKCEKCGLDMPLYWTTQVATARAVLVKEEGENMEESANRVIATIHSIGAALSSPILFLGSLFVQYVISRVRRR